MAAQNALAGRRGAEVSEKLTLRCANGSVIDVCTESNPDYPAFLSWSLGQRSMFGTYQNGVGLRQFLRKTLRFMERDQQRLDERTAKQTLRKYGVDTKQIKRFRVRATQR